jgi:hypothetical protein
LSKKKHPPASEAAPAAIPPAHRYLVIGLVLTGLYVVVALMFDNFAFPFGVDYSPPREAKYDLGIAPRLMKELSAHALVSVLAKALLLAPACAAFAFWIGRLVSKRFADGLAAWAGRLQPRTVLPVLVLAAGALLLFWSQAVFQGWPLYDDEWTYQFQAQILQTGNLAAPEPPGSECFRNVFIVQREGVWAGKYTSGHPALLALSQFMGSPYIITILLAALLPVLLFLITSDRHGAGIALLAAALLVVSPFYQLICSTLMNHGTNLFFLAAFTLCFQRSRSGTSWVYPVLAGLALGAAFNIRPQSAVGFGLAFAVLALVRLVGSERKVYLARYAVMLVSFVPLLVYAFHYNAVVTGQWHTFPFMLVEPEVAGAVGFFHPGDQTVLGHTLWKGVYYSLLNVWRLNYYLFGWGVSLVFVALFFVWRLEKAADRIWWGVIAGTVTVYLFFPSPGVLEAGPRYYFPLMIPVLILTARGMQAAHHRLSRAFPAGGPLCGRALLPTLVLLLLAAGSLTFGVEQIRHYRRLVPAVARPYAAVAERNIHDAIVLVGTLPPRGWVYGLRNNHPRLETNDVIYLWAEACEPEQMRELLAEFPRRQVYLLRFDRDGAEVKARLDPVPRERLMPVPERQ